MTSIFHRATLRREPADDSDMSSEEEPLFQSGPHDGSRINVIRNINTFARTKTLAQGFLDMALFTANASQMKHLLQQGPETPFYYFLFSLLLIVAALLIYKGSKNIECDDPEQRLSDRVHLLNNIVTGLILIITAVNVFITAFWFSPLHSTPEDHHFLAVEAPAEC
ncbi:ninjurin-1-like isoform X2 [Phyllobates terribilis]|uniref:ninjurin-1-like isoform X2 n=1 Tax=Phyllobates terribilis TaxID=111132 RepID=UPI003CCAA0E8